MFGLDSAHDYDPVWATCVELGVAPAFHSSLQYTHSARSVSSYVFNHIGGIAGNHAVLCKALVLGGVFRRFPELRVGFLEGGVAWGAALLADTVGHWRKRAATPSASSIPSTSMSPRCSRWSSATATTKICN